jgi:2-phospho-L-lactate guanylyltransferase
VSATWAIIPIKRFDRGKSRLGQALGPSERRAVAAGLFERVLRACVACVERGAIQHVLVATDAPEIARRVETRGGCSAVLDTQPAGSFASVIDAALAHAHARGAGRAIVIMADLPEITASDVAALVAGLDASEMIVVPDRARRGVGAVGWTLPAVVGAQLGRGDSFARHVEVATAKGVRVGIVNSPRVAGDVDWVGDLRSGGAFRRGLP